MHTTKSIRSAHHLLGCALGVAMLAACVSLPPSLATPAAPASVLLDNVPVGALQSLAIDLVQLRNTQRAQLAAAHDPARIDAYDERLGNLRQRIARHAGYVQATVPQGEQAQQFARVQQQLGQYLAQHRQANRAPARWRSACCPGVVAGLCRRHAAPAVDRTAEPAAIGRQREQHSAPLRSRQGRGALRAALPSQCMQRSLPIHASAYSKHVCSCGCAA